MKKITIAYWIITGIFSAFMLFSAIPDILMAPEAVTMITGLGYPKYLIPFLGVAKLLGVIAILIPGFKRIKEWAYAGLFFDLIGATYSAIAIGGFHIEVTFMVLPLGFLFLSHYLWHKKEEHKKQPAANRGMPAKEHILIFRSLSAAYRDSNFALHRAMLMVRQHMQHFYFKSCHYL